MSFPANLKYSKEHEWIDLADDGNLATIGVTSFAIEQLGDVVHLELPAVGDSLDAGATFGSIESTKTVSDLYTPASGKVLEVNEDLMDNLEGIAEDPFDEGWLIKIELSNPSDLDELMTHKEYEDFISEQS
jgi:glycine cleavage system H protein